MSNKYNIYTDIESNYIFKKNIYLNFEISCYQYKGLNIALIQENGFWFILNDKILASLQRISTNEKLTSFDQHLLKKINSMPKKPFLQKHTTYIDYKILEIDIEEVDDLENLIHLYRENFYQKEFVADHCSIGLQYFQHKDNFVKTINLFKNFGYKYLFAEMNMDYFKKNINCYEEYQLLDCIHIHNSNIFLDWDLLSVIANQYKGQLVIDFESMEYFDKLVEFAYKYHAYLVFDYNNRYEEIPEYLIKKKNALESYHWNYNPFIYCSLEYEKNRIRNSEVIESCKLGQCELYVDKDLNVYSCYCCLNANFTNFGNLYEQNLVYLWENSDLLKWMRKLNVNEFLGCKTCDFKYLCGGQCRMQVLKDKGSIYAKYSYCGLRKNLILEAIYNEYEKRLKNEL